MYIFVANMLGLPLGIVTEAHHGATFLGMELVLPDGKEEAHISWWKSPTADVAVAGALTVVVIFLTHFEGLRRNRKALPETLFRALHFVLAALNVIKEVSKPLSLSLRLYGNILCR